VIEALCVVVVCAEPSFAPLSCLLPPVKLEVTLFPDSKVPLLRVVVFSPWNSVLSEEVEGIWFRDAVEVPSIFSFDSLEFAFSEFLEFAFSEFAESCLEPTFESLVMSDEL
jgi:hypothetical protein